jgi:hypothetical protein
MMRLRNATRRSGVEFPLEELDGIDGWLFAPFWC